MASNNGSFDVSAAWVILAPFPVMGATEDLARCIGLLRAGFGLEAPAIKNALGPAPDDAVPIIVLNMDSQDDDHAGYTWRAGPGRVEIYGDSRHGLSNGIYDFLAALGFSWPGPGEELPPSKPSAEGASGGGTAAQDTAYPFKTKGAYVKSNPAPESRRRLVIPLGSSAKEIRSLGCWAARNQVDALVFSLFDRKIGRRAGEGKLAAELQNHRALIIERGGWDLSRLLPRRHFLFRRELFRMEGGKRIKQHHFCPTNPQVMDLLRRRMGAFLEPGEPGAAGPKAAPSPRRLYHLWPDRGAELRWCACPACRAFSPREQIRLAVNTVAALIAEREPLALVCCRGEEEPSAEQLPGGSELSLRANVIRLPRENVEFIYERGAGVTPPPSYPRGPS
jgi:hypothetical protein